ncbi:GNAT family N-acetyltransferase [Candidatus Albibeggiatoa sp. nov. BB20]|uniref:GNAT family N-acetyltransferase n=1 Tax=Candidatus Albibeggiatoa sp. nov. BB20 TaxID=3162723 RepID=UPI003365A5FC
MNDFQPRPANINDARLIQQLATEIWHDYYPVVISITQIEYMLKTLYSEEKLRTDIEQQRIQFTLFEWQQQSVGFLGCIIQEQQHLFLNQIYLQTAFHGRGLGQQMLQYAEQFALQQHLSSICLRVNKGNAKAITAYQRAGFYKAEAVCNEIGQGFVMDDYIMRKALSVQPT